MKNRLILFSLLLNGLLATVLFILKNRAPVSANNVQSTTASREVILKTNEAMDIVSLPRVEPEKFHWRAIESEDYPRFIANLRAVGCPEKTIVDIILADVEKLFEERRKQLETQQSFWQSADAWHDTQIAIAERKFELLEEKRALIRTLLNSDLDLELLRDWYEQHDVGLFFGFLPDEQAVRVLCTLKRYVDRFELIEDRAGGLMLPEDAEENKKTYREMVGALSRVVSSAEVEEGELRVVLLLRYLFASGGLKEAKLSGAELRHLMKLRNNFEKPIEFQLSDFSGRDTVPQVAAEQEFTRQARQFLGETRFQQYLKAHDSDFKQLYETAERNGQPQIAMGVYEIQKAVELESLRVSENRVIARKEQQVELQAIQHSAREAIHRLLGDKIQMYSTNLAHWMHDSQKR